MNIDPTQIQTATIVLANCRGYDQWFPKASESTILAWATAFEGSRLDRDTLTAGVDHAYANEEGEFRPKPADIIRHARAARREALRNLPKNEVDDMEAANHILQELDFTPQEAHRISRQVALKQKRLDELLSVEKLVEFKQRFDRHRNRTQLFTDRRRELAQKLRVADLFAIEGRAS